MYVCTSEDVRKCAELTLFMRILQLIDCGIWGWTFEKKMISANHIEIVLKDRGGKFDGSSLYLAYM